MRFNAFQVKDSSTVDRYFDHHPKIPKDSFFSNLYFILAVIVEIWAQTNQPNIYFPKLGIPMSIYKILNYMEHMICCNYPYHVDHTVWFIPYGNHMVHITWPKSYIENKTPTEQIQQKHFKCNGTNATPYNGTNKTVTLVKIGTTLGNIQPEMTTKNSCYKL